ncbi:MAG TPA: universal stress protein [Nitrosomonas nitrosa]|nr:universal stress protein [Nitrosomonas nitrosa]
MNVRAPFMSAANYKVAMYVKQVQQQHQKNLDALTHKVTSFLGQDAMDYLKPQIHLLKGSARKEAPAISRQLGADLIVMGTVARTGIPGFIIGNAAEETFSVKSIVQCSRSNRLNLQHPLRWRCNTNASALSGIGSFSAAQFMRGNVARTTRSDNS